MPAIVLYRIDPTRNMRRFYRLWLQIDLFGCCCVIREWGRIGRSSRMLTNSYPTEAAAEAALTRQLRSKQRRGYQ